MNAKTEALISVWFGPVLSRHGATKLRSLSAGFRKAVGKVYSLGILAYFAAAGIQAISITYFSDWLPYVGRHAMYAFAWPIIVPIEISSGRGPSSPRQWLRLIPAESGDRQVDSIMGAEPKQIGPAPPSSKATAAVTVPTGSRWAAETPRM